MLPPWAFYLTVSLALLSVFLYILECIVILKNWKSFKGSFFKIYFASSVFNCWTYFNSLLTLRLPKQTHKDEFFSPIFEAKYIFGLEFMYCMMFHFAFVQYQMNALFAINRVTAIVFPVLYEKIWRVCFIPSIVIIYFLPFILTYPLAMANTEYYYKAETNNYGVHSSTPTFLNIMSHLTKAMIALTVVTTVLNGVVFILFWRRPNYAGKVTRSNDLKLFIHNIIIFGTQAFAVVVLLVETQSKFAVEAIPFVSDTLTLLPAFIILLCSSTLQDGLRNLIWKTHVIKIVQVSPTSNIHT